MGPIRSKPLVKAVACLLVLSFGTMETGLSAAAVLPAGAPAKASTAGPADIGRVISDPSLFEAPFDFVNLKDFHAGDSGRLIIHIQDAHSNLSGQESLAAAMDAVIRRYGISTVLVEGSSRDVSLTDARNSAPIETWKQVAKRFLYDGIISGEEYLNLTTEYPMSLIGIEDRALYDQSLEAYASIVDKRRDILIYLHKLSTSLSRVKRKLYPKEVMDYEENKDKSEGGPHGSLNALFKLSSQYAVSLTEGFEEMPKLRAVQAREKEIDFAKANTEQARLLGELSRKGARNEIEAFARASKRAKNTQLAQYMLLSEIFRAADRYGVRTSAYPELLKYMRYLKDFAGLKLDVLVDEIDRLEEKIFAAALADADVRRVHAVDRFVRLLKNAYSLQMSSKEFRLFTENSPDFATQSWQAFLNQKLAELGYFEDIVPYLAVMDDARPGLEQFYKLVDKRDLAFIENARKAFDERGDKAAFLIAGGYHTQHLSELLRQNGFSYIVLTPVVSYETDQGRYEELLLAPIQEARRAQDSKVAKKDGEEETPKADTLKQGGTGEHIAGQAGLTFGEARLRIVYDKAKPVNPQIFELGKNLGLRAPASERAWPEQEPALTGVRLKSEELAKTLEDAPAGAKLFVDKSTFAANVLAGLDEADQRALVNAWNEYVQWVRLNAGLKDVLNDKANHLHAMLVFMHVSRLQNFTAGFTAFRDGDDPSKTPDYASAGAMNAAFNDAMSGYINRSAGRENKDRLAVLKKLALAENPAFEPATPRRTVGAWWDRMKQRAKNAVNAVRTPGVRQEWLDKAQGVLSRREMTEFSGLIDDVIEDFNWGTDPANRPQLIRNDLYTRQADFLLYLLRFHGLEEAAARKVLLQFRPKDGAAYDASKAALEPGLFEAAEEFLRLRYEEKDWLARHEEVKIDTLNAEFGEIALGRGGMGENRAAEMPANRKGTYYYLLNVYRVKDIAGAFAKGPSIPGQPADFETWADEIGWPNELVFSLQDYEIIGRYEKGRQDQDSTQKRLDVLTILINPKFLVIERPEDFVVKKVGIFRVLTRAGEEAAARTLPFVQPVSSEPAVERAIAGARIDMRLFREDAQTIFAETRARFVAFELEKHSTVTHLLYRDVMQDSMEFPSYDVLDLLERAADLDDGGEAAESVMKAAAIVELSATGYPNLDPIPGEQQDEDAARIMEMPYAEVRRLVTERSWGPAGSRFTGKRKLENDLLETVRRIAGLNVLGITTKNIRLTLPDGRIVDQPFDLSQVMRQRGEFDAAMEWVQEIYGLGDGEFEAANFNVTGNVGEGILISMASTELRAAGSRAPMDRDRIITRLIGTFNELRARIPNETSENRQILNTRVVFLQGLVNPVYDSPSGDMSEVGFRGILWGTRQELLDRSPADRAQFEREALSDVYLNEVVDAVFSAAGSRVVEDAIAEADAILETIRVLQRPTPELSVRVIKTAQAAAEAIRKVEDNGSARRSGTMSRVDELRDKLGSLMDFVYAAPFPKTEPEAVGQVALGIAGIYSLAETLVLTPNTERGGDGLRKILATASPETKRLAYEVFSYVSFYVDKAVQEKAIQDDSSVTAGNLYLPRSKSYREKLEKSGTAMPVILPASIIVKSGGVNVARLVREAAFRADQVLEKQRFTLTLKAPVGEAIEAAKRMAVAVREGEASGLSATDRDFAANLEYLRSAINTIFEDASSMPVPNGIFEAVTRVYEVAQAFFSLAQSLALSEERDDDKTRKILSTATPETLRLAERVFGRVRPYVQKAVQETPVLKDALPPGGYLHLLANRPTAILPRSDLYAQKLKSAGSRVGEPRAESREPRDEGREEIQTIGQPTGARIVEQAPTGTRLAPQDEQIVSRAEQEWLSVVLEPMVARINGLIKTPGRKVETQGVDPKILSTDTKAWVKKMLSESGVLKGFSSDEAESVVNYAYLSRPILYDSDFSSLGIPTSEQDKFRAAFRNFYDYSYQFQHREDYGSSDLFAGDQDMVQPYGTYLETADGFAQEAKRTVGTNTGFPEFRARNYLLAAMYLIKAFHRQESSENDQALKGRVAGLLGDAVTEFEASSTKRPQVMEAQLPFLRVLTKHSDALVNLMLKKYREADDREAKQAGPRIRLVWQGTEKEGVGRDFYDFMTTITKQITIKENLPLPAGQEIEVPFKQLSVEGNANYAAMVTLAGRKYVIKTNLMDIGQILTEWKVLQTLNPDGRNPHVAAPVLFGVVEGGYKPFRVARYLEGKSLGQRIFDEGPMGRDEAVQFILKLSRVVQSIHEKGIVIRELKPDNVLMTEGDDAALFDFGVSLFPEYDWNDDVYDFKSTVQHVFADDGRRYPSSAEEKKRLRPDFTSDVYTLGMDLYYALTGNMDISLRYDLIKNKELFEIIHKATQPRRNSDKERDKYSYRNVQEFISDLEKLSQQPAGARLGTAPIRAEGLLQQDQPLPLWRPIPRDMMPKIAESELFVRVAASGTRMKELRGQAPFLLAASGIDLDGRGLAVLARLPQKGRGIEVSTDGSRFTAVPISEDVLTAAAQATAGARVLAEPSRSLDIEDMDLQDSGRNSRQLFNFLRESIRSGKKPGAVMVPLNGLRGTEGPVVEDLILQGNLIRLKATAQLLKSLGFQVSLERDPSDEVNAVVEAEGMGELFAPPVAGVKTILMATKETIKSRGIEPGMGVYPILPLKAQPGATELAARQLTGELLIAAAESMVRSPEDQVGLRVVDFISRIKGVFADRGRIADTLRRAALGQDITDEFLDEAESLISLPEILKLKIGEYLQKMRSIVTQMATWA